MFRRVAGGSGFAFSSPVSMMSSTTSCGRRTPALQASRISPCHIVAESQTINNVMNMPVVSSQLRFASKTSSGVSRNQRGKKHRRRNVGFQYLKDRPAPAGLVLTQRAWYQGNTLGPHEPWVRKPEFLPGKNVKLVNDHYDLHAEKQGVMTFRRSHVDSKVKWLDIEPDINKVWRTRGLQRHLADRGQLFQYNEREALDAQQPDWRLEVMQQANRPQYVDPNLLSRGVVTSIDPQKKAITF